MKISNLYFFLPLFFVSLANANDVETPLINFGGGLNVKQNPSDIEDNESPDMSNLVNDIFGASFKRNGGKRYISQAISSNPVNSLYRAYASTGTDFKKVLIATSKDSIYVTSQDVVPQWIQVASFTYPNQRWNFVTMGNKVILSPESLQDSIKQFDINTSSLTNLISIDGSTNTANIRGKYPLTTRNYFLLANCADVSSPTALTASTTYYPSRMYYSLLLQPSSMTAQRYLDVRTDDGEPLMGLSELNRFVHLWKQTTITELDFSILNLSNLGGDQILKTIVQGFGLFAPHTLASTGDGYIFGSKDGLRFWDGGRRSRLQVDQESRPLSTKIQPIIDRCIKADTWKNSVGKYYPKKHWYILSFEDPERQPHGKNNSILVFDFINGNWYPFRNLTVQSFEVLDGIGDNGQLVYGDSSDGYVYLADRDDSPNDPRKEIVVETMDSTSTWARGAQDVQNVVEGTGAIKSSLIWNTYYSSITMMKVINLASWYDGTEVTKSDKLSFKVYVTSIGNLSSLRVDLEVNDVSGDFDSNFTSITISSSALTPSNTSWTTVELPISSFPIRPDWIDLSTETVPFAKSFTFYGVRFVSTGVAVTSVTIDDLRVVQSMENPLNSYRYTKQFSFGTTSPKRFRQLILNRELPSDSVFSIDVFTDFGIFAKKVSISGGFPKELFVAGWGGTNSIARINSVDFSFIDSTTSLSNSAFEYRYIAADQKWIFAADATNDRLVKIDRSSIGVILSSVGVFGAGTTNFNTIQEISLDNDNAYVTDVNNHRIKIHKKSNLDFLAQFGSLGLGATSYHSPVGICTDGNYIFVANEGNLELAKVSKSSYTKVQTLSLNINGIAEMTLQCDDKFLYDAYNFINESDITQQDVILEKRSKETLALLNRVVVRPQNVLSLSTYAIKGDMGQTDDYLYVSFTDDPNVARNYYIQKRLKGDFSVVREHKTNLPHLTVAANGIGFVPKRKNQVEDLNAEGSYLQLKYSESGLDNSVKLFSQAFLIIPEGVVETK